MNERKDITLLQLEGTPPLPPVQGIHLVTASSREEALHLLSAHSPDLLVMQGEIPWQVAWVSSLSPERRPATLLFGQIQGSVAFTDEWLGDGHLVRPDELVSRIALARARAFARRRASRRAYVDLLTGLPNRRALVRGLLREAQRARRFGTPLSLALIDLDNFKRVNDQEGHPAGDRLLRRVGATLRRTTRGNELCGRLGGDEFAIVLSGDMSQALQVAQRAVQALAGMGAPGTYAVCALGLHETLKGLYRRTDCELQSAKAAKKGGSLSLGNAPPPPPVFEALTNVKSV